MQWIDLSAKIWVFLRSYAVTVALVIALTAAFVEVYVFGTGPMPQQPPEGYVVEQTTATLQWNKGTRSQPIRLQVAKGDPHFAKPMLDREVSGTTHRMNELEPGNTYYWRLLQGDKPSPLATFKISAYAIDF